MLIINKQAEKILTTTFWASGGWKPDPDWPPPDKRAIAESAGYMFTPVGFHHDELVSQVRTLATASSREVAASSFVASLSTHWRFLRSFLPSVVVGQQLPDHRFTPQDDLQYLCAICGQIEERPDLERDVLSFERHRWGGVRPLDLEYIWFTLDCFAREGGAEPTAADLELLGGCLTALERLDPDTTLTKAEPALKAIPSGKDERLVLLAILSIVGVLVHPDHPGFLDQFVPEVERELPPKRFAERDYPGEWWTAQHGVNADAVRRLFPQLGWKS